MNLHPKILAAFLAAVGVLIVTVGNSVIDAYPTESWTPLIAAAVPVIAGWWKSSTGGE